MAEITAKFRERALLVPQYATDEEMKKTKYHDMWRDDIREFVSLPWCKNLNDMIARVCEQEIDLERLGNRKSEQIQMAVGQVNKPRT